ncbi:unnamed protein product [Laminaria digitata]
MTSLHNIHEAGILYNLGERSKLLNQRPYTFMGTVLIAVNPLRRIPHPDMSEYMDCSLDPEAPHPYAIAELAYHQMRLGAGRKIANQSIVVSGESGAGKTETSKIIITFLTHRSVGGVTELEQKVVDSSPILESFGNAKTLRNDNSSRFGKFLKLQFTKDKYRLAGAFIETHLLEKSRVLSHGPGERNFHILYELVTGGASSGLSAELKLDSVESFKIICHGGCTTLDGVDDAVQFQGVKAAFDTIGMSAGTQMEVWKMLASVLHMSNLRFDKVDNEQGEIASISDREALSTLATLLGVKESALEALLTQRVVATLGEVFTKQLSVPDANLTRDAIVTSLYESLFQWIVAVINSSLGRDEDSLPFIGVLDIFGFENFGTKNEFEQLLINFTNESLQDTFNRQIFNNELKLYQEEGIDVVVSTCPDNAECLKMLCSMPRGIIPSLDNVCAEPSPSDCRYLEGLHRTYARHQDFPRTKPKNMRECFWVKHYAGKVKYTVEGWVERNMDRVPPSFHDTLQRSTHKVVIEATSKYGQVPAGSPRTARPRRQTLVKPTVAKAFLGSMQDLNVTLLSTTCNFIRCIKPNAAMQCGLYDNRYVVDQLQCLGILQTCEVLKVGMPTRVTYTELKEVLGDNAAEAETLFKGEPESALVAAILWAFEVPSEAFRLGRTRVFFRAGQISILQEILNETSADRGPVILGRLQEALANRHTAKGAAEEAQFAVTSAEVAVNKAQQEATKALGAEEDDGDGSVRSDDGQHELESAAKKARKAGNCVLQLHACVEAAREGEVGTYAEGAMDRVTTAFKETLRTMNASSAMADELEVATITAKGGDVAGEMRQLEVTLERLCESFQEAKRLAAGSQEAAAKCQASAVTYAAKDIAQAAERQMEALAKAKSMLSSVTAATEEALAALSFFKTLVADASLEEMKAREMKEKEMKEKELKAKELKAKELKAKELKARELKAIELKAMELKAKELKVKELKAKEASDAKAVAEARSLAAAQKAEQEAAEKDENAARKVIHVYISLCVSFSSSPPFRPRQSLRQIIQLSVTLHYTLMPLSMQALLECCSHRALVLGSALDTSETRDHAADLASPRGGLVKTILSRSVENLPSTAGTIDARYVQSVPHADVSHAEVSCSSAMLWKRHTSFRNMFKEAMEGGCMEGHLIKLSTYASQGELHYFQLKGGILTCYDKRSLARTRNNECMELTAHSVTVHTNVRNCFSVRTGLVAWFLQAKNEAEMSEWMTAVNAQVHWLFTKCCNVPEDNYWSQGLKGQFFYRMVDGAQPQWIRTFPEEAAPRTGDGVFPGEVIEVTQAMSNKGKIYLRIASNRGWMHALNPSDDSALFEEIKGEVAADKNIYGCAKSPVPRLFGPSLASQQTGEALMPGECCEGRERFTPCDGSGAAFIKLADGRGWVPLRQNSGCFGVYCTETRSSRAPTHGG